MLRDILFINYCGVKRGPQAKSASTSTAYMMQMQSLNIFATFSVIVIGILPLKLSLYGLAGVYLILILCSLLLHSTYKRLIQEFDLETLFQQTSEKVRKRNWVLGYFLYFGSILLFMGVCMSMLSNYLNR